MGSDEVIREVILHFSESERFIGLDEKAAVDISARDSSAFQCLSNRERGKNLTETHDIVFRSCREFLGEIDPMKDVREVNEPLTDKLLSCAPISTRDKFCESVQVAFPDRTEVGKILPVTLGREETGSNQLIRDTLICRTHNNQVLLISASVLDNFDRVFNPRSIAQGRTAKFHDFHIPHHKRKNRLPFCEVGLL
jgi:hypothetical protein